MNDLYDPEQIKMKLMNNDQNIFSEKIKLARIIHFTIRILYYMQSIQFHVDYFINARISYRKKSRKKNEERNQFFFLIIYCRTKLSQRKRISNYSFHLLHIIIIPNCLCASKSIYFVKIYYREKSIFFFY